MREDKDEGYYFIFTLTLTLSPQGRGNYEERMHQISAGKPE
jgi:hypothetical protein